MKVAVVGPGAMGCLYAARLAKGGHKIILVDHREDRAARLRKSGVTLETGDVKDHVTVDVNTRVPTGQDLVIVLTKSHHTANLHLPPECPVLTLQNGLGNVETLCSLVGSARVLAGSSTDGATLLAEGHVRGCGVGKTVIGSWTSCDPKPVLEILVKAGIDAEITEAPGQMIWEKTAINAGINPLSAILNVPNGKLLGMNEIRQLMRDLVVEAAKVAATEGYRFDRSLVEMTEDICLNTAENISSMLQDIRAGRRTEIEAISGEILRRAQVASLPTPRTRVIYQLIRGLDAR